MSQPVADVLREIGWPLGTAHADRCRTCCPIHKGHNPQAFSYRENLWTCFAGCGSGGVKKLREELGIIPLPPPPPPSIPARRILGMDFETPSLKPHVHRPSVSQQLEANFRLQVQLRRQEAEEKHAWCIHILCQTDDRLREIGQAFPEPEELFPPEAIERWERLAQVWVEAMQQLREVHAELIVLAWASRLDPRVAFDPCFGSCYASTDARVTPETFDEVASWVARQDEDFRTMVQKFLGE